MARQSVFGKICDRTIVHGIPDWYNAKKIPAKVVWSLVLLGAVAAIVFYSYQMISSYLQFQTVTQISEVRVLKMPFPNVTICHGVRFNKTYIEDSINLPPSTPIPAGYDSASIKSEFVRYFSALAYQTVQFPSDVKEYLKQTYDYNFDPKVNTGAFDVLAFVNQSSFSCEAMFGTRPCSFNGKFFTCCSLARPVLSDYGVCYHIQVGQDKVGPAPYSTDTGLHRSSYKTVIRTTADPQCSLSLGSYSASRPP